MLDYNAIFRILFDDIFLILLSDNKMIHYSPSSRYTAQKIADKVAHGAYFYSHFSVESDEALLADPIQKIVAKLTGKYSLDLSPRQRTYRLNTKKEPIADLIVQKRFTSKTWDFWLLITTPKSNEYNNSKSEITLKKIVNQRVSEAETIWNRELEKEQVRIIQQYFDDHEKFKFVLQKPFLKLAFGQGKFVELVRLSHSSKKSKTYSQTEKGAKNYTWTWRYDEPTVQLIKKKYVEIMNTLISNKDKSVGMNDLQKFYDDLKYYSVFKGNRHQIGKLFVDAVSYHYKKTGNNFRKADYYVGLELNYLPRLQNYADNFTQYIFLRRLYEFAGVALDKDVVNQDTYNELLNEYLV